MFHHFILFSFYFGFWIKCFGRVHGSWCGSMTSRKYASKSSTCPAKASRPAATGGSMLGGRPFWAVGTPA